MIPDSKALQLSKCLFLKGLLSATVLVWTAKYEDGDDVSWTTAAEGYG